MTIETAELVSRLNASRDSLKQLNIGEYTLIRSARDVMADAANALDAYDKTMQRIAEEPSALTHRQAAALIRSAPAPGREEIARVIDPDAWLLFENANVLTMMRPTVSEWRVAPSLTKADAILALFHAPADPGGGEAIEPFVTWAASVMAGEAENVGNGFAPFNDADEYVEGITYGDLRRLAKAPTPPAGDGWKLVPNVPTPEMIEAGADYRPLDAETKARETYRAMLAAAPPPPVSKGEKL